MEVDVLIEASTQRTPEILLETHTHTHTHSLTLTGLTGLALIVVEMRPNGEHAQGIFSVGQYVASKPIPLSRTGSRCGEKWSIASGFEV